jgi:hypothetical protein
MHCRYRDKTPIHNNSASRTVNCKFCFYSYDEALWSLDLIFVCLCVEWLLTVKLGFLSGLAGLTIALPGQLIAHCVFICICVLRLSGFDFRMAFCGMALDCEALFIRWLGLA